MSRTIKGSPKYGSIPSKFKRQLKRSVKMKIKENTRQMINNPEDIGAIRLRKDHVWEWL